MTENSAAATCERAPQGHASAHSSQLNRKRLKRLDQYFFLGSIWLRRRLWWRFTAADFLRLRSAVGFS